MHVIGPEQGLTLPGMTIVCGDSHTATHGAFGTLAFGIGTSEVEHVLATQTLQQNKAKTMLINIEGKLAKGVASKDIILYIIGLTGTAGATGYCVEYAGSAIRDLSMEARMMICNMSIEAGARAGIDDFTRVGKKVPVLADLKPSGRSVTAELAAIGGLTPLMKMFLDRGLLHGECLTVTGKTVKENLKNVKLYPAGQEIIRPFDNPIKKEGHLVILYGNLAPDGAVAKITGKEGLKFTGRAKVFESEETALKAILAGKIVKGDVIVIRYEGPRGGPGMREMLSPTSAISGKGLGKFVYKDLYARASYPY